MRVTVVKMRKTREFIRIEQDFLVIHFLIERILYICKLDNLHRLDICCKISVKNKSEICNERFRLN